MLPGTDALLFRMRLFVDELVDLDDGNKTAVEDAVFWPPMVDWEGFSGQLMLFITGLFFDLFDDDVEVFVVLSADFCGAMTDGDVGGGAGG